MSENISGKIIAITSASNWLGAATAKLLSSRRAITVLGVGSLSELRN
jgi:NAD(P)-dependent dehydrogenase (short-subunit alcohol dehydrogenase family)